MVVGLVAFVAFLVWVSNGPAFYDAHFDAVYGADPEVCAHDERDQLRRCCPRCGLTDAERLGYPRLKGE